MEEKIYFYELNGKIKEICDLTEENLKKVIGMQIKIIFVNETEKVGYATAGDGYYKSGFDDLINNLRLWTLKDFDESKPNNIYEQIFEDISLNDVDKIIALIHSSPRFGVNPSNKFLLDIPKKTPSKLLSYYLKNSFGKKVKIKMNDGNIMTGILDSYSRQEDNDDVCWSISIQTDNSLNYLLDDEIDDIVAFDKDFVVKENKSFNPFEDKSNKNDIIL